MARPIKGDRELSWHKASKRWCKVIRGKREYFGKGKCKTDTASYRAAVKKYRAFMDELDELESDSKIRQRVLGDLFARPHSLETMMLYQPVLPGMPYQEQIREANRARFENYIEHHVEQDRLERKVQPASTSTELDKLTDEYLADQEHRHQLTLTAPETMNKKKRLSAVTLRDIKACIRQFKKFASSVNISDISEEGNAELLLSEYRKHLVSKITDGSLKPVSVNNRLRYIKPFFEWAWENRHIDSLPRNLIKSVEKFGHNPSAKPLPIKTVQKIWNAADGRMKCMIALVLNLAAYSTEIASLRTEHLLEGGYIAKHRNKTGVPYIIQLWFITRRLIKMYRDDLTKDTGGLLFVTRAGYPLVHSTEKSKTDSLAQAFGKLCKRIKVKATWSRFHDTAANELEKIAVNGDGESDSTLVSQLLAHSDKRIAKYYLEGEPAKLERAKLDKAVMQLEKVFDLKMD